MRFGVCLPGNFTLPNSPAEGQTEQIRALVDGYRFIREAGYDYIEFAVGNFANFSEEDMALAVDYYKKGMLKVEACNSFIPGTLPLVGDQVDLEAVRAYLELVLPRMASVGVQIVVFGSGGARRIPEGVSAEQAQRQLDEFMTLAEGIARRVGITIVIEPLNHKECNTLLPVSEGAVAARRVNLPNLKLLADLYHTFVENEDPQVLIDNADILCHTHVAEPVNRTIPVDHPYLRACGEALRKAGYNARMSIECGTKDFASEVIGALPIMKELFN